MEVIFGPGHQLYHCLACGQQFVWHPGSSNSKRPSECGYCGQEDKFKLLRCVPEDQVRVDQ